MALPSYSTGTVSIEAGGTTAIGVGTIWTGGNAREGDDFVIAGVLARIVDVVSATELTITKWVGAAVSGGEYVIYQNASRRFDDVEIADDLRKQVAALNNAGFFHFVPPDATEPDPSLGDELQVALQESTGKTWQKQSGVWVFIGINRGVNPRGAWNSATAYAVNDVVSRNGSAYMAIAANTNSAPPSGNWMLLGAAGAAAVVAVGTVTTGAPGSAAAVANSGTPNAAVLDFTIPTGKGYGGTSSASMTIDGDPKTFPIQAGLAYVFGDRVHIGAVGNELNWMEGYVTAYSGTSMTVAVSDYDGSGTFTSWGIGLTGKPGLGDGDMKGANNGSDFTDTDAVLINVTARGRDGELRRLKTAGFRNSVFWGGNNVIYSGSSEATSGTSSRRTILSKDLIYAARQDGYIRKVRLQITTNDGSSNNCFWVKVLRPNGSSYDVVSTSGFILIGAGTGTKDYVLPTPVGPFKMGDKLGITMSSITDGSWKIGVVANSGFTVSYVDADVTGGETYSDIANFMLCAQMFGPSPVFGVFGDSLVSGQNGGPGHFWLPAYQTGGITGERDSEPFYFVDQALGTDHQNSAVGGSKWADVYTRIAYSMSTIEVKPQAILIHCGIAAIVGGVSWATTEADMYKCIDALTGINKVYINEILPWTGDDTQAATIREWNSRYADFCDKTGAILVPVHDAMATTRVSTGELDDPLYANPYDDHLTKEGVEVFAGLMADTIRATI